MEGDQINSLPMKPNKQHQNRGGIIPPSGTFFFALLFTLTLLMGSFTQAAIDLNNSEAYWSFENFPATSVSDITGNGHLATVQNPSNTPTTFAKIGDWAAYVGYPTTGFGAPDYYEDWSINSTNITTGTESGNPSGSASLWFYLSSAFNISGINISFEIAQLYGTLRLDDDSSRGINLRVDHTDNQLYYITGSNAACVNNRVETGVYLDFNEWYNIIIVQNGSSYTPPYQQLYVNGIKQNLTVVSGSAFPISSFNTDQYLGRTANCSFTTGVESLGTVYIDEVAFWNYSLNQDEVEFLYNDGFGYNPVNPEPPAQTTPLPDINMVYSDNYTITYRNYFSNAQEVTYNFTYGTISYQGDTNNDVTTPAFSIQHLAGTAFKIYSFTTTVQPLTMNITVSNGVGNASALQVLTITSTPSSGGGEAEGGYFSNLLRAFPNSDDLPTSTKTFVVVLFLIGAAVAGGLMFNEKRSYLIVLGTALTEIALIVFFTSIGYIPVWMTILMFILAVLIAAVVANRTFFGSSGGDF